MTFRLLGIEFLAFTFVAIDQFSLEIMTLISNTPHQLLDKLKSFISKFDNAEFKDELLLFMVVINIMLVLILLNFYIQD